MPTMSATKLTDTQLITLSAASQREDSGVVLPPNLKGGAAQKFVAKLIALGFAVEIRARGDLPVWRRDDDNRPMALRITKRGLTAIAVENADQGSSEADADNQGIAAQAKPARKKVRGNAALSGATDGARSNRAGSKQAQIIALLRRPEG